MSTISISKLLHFQAHSNLCLHKSFVNRSILFKPIFGLWGSQSSLWCSDICHGLPIKYSQFWNKYNRGRDWQYPKKAFVLSWETYCNKCWSNNKMRELRYKRYWSINLSKMKWRRSRNNLTWIKYSSQSRSQRISLWLQTQCLTQRILIRCTEGPF